MTAVSKLQRDVAELKTGRRQKDATGMLMCNAELSVGWVDPRVELGWVGSGMGRKFVF